MATITAGEVPVSVGRKVFVFISWVFGTGTCGVIAGLAGALIGAFVLRGELLGFGGFLGAMAGMVAGYPLGVIAGLVISGRFIRHYGSILLGIIGVFLGLLLSAGLTELLNLHDSPSVFIVMFFLTIPLLSETGYRIRRKAAA